MTLNERLVHNLKGTTISLTRELDVNEAIRFDRKPQVLNVISGSAWVTFDAQDVILDGCSGEFCIPAGKHPVVISNIGKKRLTIQIEST